MFKRSATRRNQRRSSGPSALRRALAAVPLRRVLPVAAWAVVAVGAFLGLRMVLDRPLTQVHITGRFQRVQPLDVEKAVRSQVGRKGLVSVDLAAVSLAVREIPWVDRAKVGRAWPQSQYEELGLPVPLAVSGGFVIAMLSNMIITQLLVPECMRLADDGFMKGDTWEARLNGLRWAKWPALASLASVGVLIAGSAIESGNFGNGQALIAGGLVGFLASWLAYVIVDVWGTYRGYVDSRRERRPVL